MTLSETRIDLFLQCLHHFAGCWYSFFLLVKWTINTCTEKTTEKEHVSCMVGRRLNVAPGGPSQFIPINADSILPGLSKPNVLLDNLSFINHLLCESRFRGYRMRPKQKGQQVIYYPLVISQFAVEVMAHENWWFDMICLIIQHIYIYIYFKPC